jgi:hypothetical protein
MKTLTIILLAIALNCQAQNDHLKYAVFNTGINAIIGGIGSGIHHKKCESFIHAFGQGCWKGVISGSLNTISKEMLSIQADKDVLNWKLCWSSKIVNSVSNTMLYNATMNESNLFKHYAIDIGFLRFSTDYKVQIEPISLGCFAGIMITGGNLNVNQSLTIGTPVFEYEFKRNNNFFSTYNLSLGQTLANNIMIEKRHQLTVIRNENNSSSLLITNKVVTNTLLHENCHVYQRLQWSKINNFFNIYNKYENLKYFHNDLSMFDVLYFGQNLTLGYNNNIFEHEANFFGKSNY